MQERRKKILVDRGLQYRYSLLNVLLLLIFAFLAGLTVYISLRFGLLAGQLGTYAEQALKQVFIGLRLLFIIEAIVFVIIAILVSIRISLRIAGPVYHIKEGLREIAQGNYGARLEFRKKDELKEIASEFNKMAEALGERQKQNQ